MAKLSFEDDLGNSNKSPCLKIRPCCSQVVKGGGGGEMEFWRARRDQLWSELTRLGGLILPPLPRPEIIVAA